MNGNLGESKDEQLGVVRNIAGGRGSKEKT